jgi:rhodanese-related sulfurtransferase
MKKNMLIFGTLVVTSMFFLGCINNIGYIDLTAEEAKELIDTTPDLVIIDVSPKYDEGHIPGAINYYVGDGSLDEAIPTLDKNVSYLVYCHVDSASILGATKLVQAGFDPVYRLEGNYQAWIDAGYPVTGESGYADVTAIQAKDLIDNNTNIVVIDVSPLYNQGHIPGAINYYIGDGSLDGAIPTLDKEKDYLVYCHTDSASINGAEKLVAVGFNPVYRLEGNYQAWIDAGYDVEP